MKIEFNDNAKVAVQWMAGAIVVATGLAYAGSEIIWTVAILFAVFLFWGGAGEDDAKDS